MVKSGDRECNRRESDGVTITRLVMRSGREVWVIGKEVRGKQVTTQGAWTVVLGVGLHLPEYLHVVLLDLSCFWSLSLRSVLHRSRRPLLDLLYNPHPLPMLLIPTVLFTSARYIFLLCGCRRPTQRWVTCVLPIYFLVHYVTIELGDVSNACVSWEFT